jgi:hypothetical protein
LERQKISYFLDKADDTVKGTRYLVNKAPDVAVGQKWVGSTDTAADSVAVSN